MSNILPDDFGNRRHLNQLGFLYIDNSTGPVRGDPNYTASLLSNRMTSCKFRQMFNALFAQPVRSLGLFMPYLLYQFRHGGGSGLRLNDGFDVKLEIVDDCLWLDPP